MTAWVRRIHKWLGLLIGLQFVLWMASGALMSLLDSEQVSGSVSRMPKPAAAQWPQNVMSVDTILAKERAPVRALATGWLLGQPVYHLTNSKGTRLVDARTAQPLAIDATTARKLALASYAGAGDPGVPRLLARSGEVRKHKGHVWAVDFADADDTAVYVSAETGAIVAHRNSTWRLFDFFWMLHIMDYWEREDFNHPLLIGSGIGGLWLALSGVWLLITSLRWAEFIPARFRSTRSLEIFTEDGVKLRTTTGKRGDTVFVALARAGVNVPSQCGGGQSCGLCVVRVRGAATQPTGADAAHIAQDKLASGYRLACNLGLYDDMTVEVPSAAAPGSTWHAIVRSVSHVTPSMREIVLTLDLSPAQPFWPGSYLQVQVPPYEIALELGPANAAPPAPSELGQSAAVSNVSAVRRSYSLSLPPGSEQRTLTLLVRLMSAQQAEGSRLYGVGSGYMFSLRQGDRIELAGPFGDFAIQEGDREKIFIGGGAGMAPLRAMITQLLTAGATEQIHFWYGARSVAETPYLDEMNALARDYANFSWQLVLSDETPGADPVLGGLVHQWLHELLLAQHADLASCDFYVCGPPAMLHATRQMLAQIGVAPSRILFDDFKV